MPNGKRVKSADMRELRRAARVIPVSADPAVLNAYYLSHDFKHCLVRIAWLGLAAWLCGFFHPACTWWCCHFCLPQTSCMRSCDSAQVNGGHLS